jgi:DNA polymerase III delta prime subunit
MIPKLFISPSLETRVGEIHKSLASHTRSAKLDKTHPDVLYFEAETKLGIEQARLIKEHFSIKPYSAEGRVVVLEDGSVLTPEAQNALLKTFEEAPEKAVILIGIASESDLLPTVLSRCELIYIKNPEVLTYSTSEVDYAKDINKLQNSSFEQRFEYIEKLKEREELLSALVFYWRNQLHLLTKNSPIDKKTVNEIKNYLQALLEAEKWAKRNVNIRAILEYLMLIMPK